MQFNRCLGCMEEIQCYPCPNCGFDPKATPASSYVLPLGAVLNGHYVVGKVLGQGGFGITYMGFDLNLERKVAIKEFYPKGQASRFSTTSTCLQWPDDPQSQTFRKSGTESFLREAQKMAKVEDIPEVVRVRECFYENGTAYIVMDYIEGKTLLAVLKEKGPMTWDQARDIFLPAVTAMEKVHQAGMIHRDLSPDNLMLTDKGVRILDLGAAKDLSTGNGASSNQVAKSGFSPLEQYTQRGGTGTWSDVYAMAATMYYTLTGVLPPNATDRVEEDTLSWTLLIKRGVPTNVINALQKAMNIIAKGRTQTMAELLNGLQGGGASQSNSSAVSPEALYAQLTAQLSKAATARDFQSLGQRFLQLGDFQDARQQARLCADRARECEAREAYAEAVRLLDSDSLPALRMGLSALKNAGGIGDSEALLASYTAKIQRLEEEETLRRASLRKKRRRLAAIACAAIFVLYLSSLLYRNLYIPWKKNADAYDRALSLYNQGEYLDAVSAFSRLGDFRDSAELAKASSQKLQDAYNDAKKLLKAGKYDEAIAAFTALEDYSDAKDQVNAAYYEKGSSLYQKGQYEEAAAIFEALGSYPDAGQQYKLCIAGLAQQALDAGDFSQALTLYTKAGVSSYREQVNLCHHQLGEDCQNSGKWSDAIKHYAAISTSYSKYDTIQSSLKECKYQFILTQPETATAYKTYLNELYKDPAYKSRVTATYKKVYAWKVRLDCFNTSSSDYSTILKSVSTDCSYLQFGFTITNGPPDEKVNMFAVVHFPDGSTRWESWSWEDCSTGGSFYLEWANGLWLRNSYRGKLTVDICIRGTNEKIDSFSINLT